MTSLILEVGGNFAFVERIRLKIFGHLCFEYQSEIFSKVYIYTTHLKLGL